MKHDIGQIVQQYLSDMNEMSPQYINSYVNVKDSVLSFYRPQKNSNSNFSPRI